jgi:succinate dehydrogenase (ubiquinone) cytochrome b560 subunit
LPILWFQQPDTQAVIPGVPLYNTALTTRKSILLTPAPNAVLKQSRFQSNNAKIQMLSAKEGQQLLANRRLDRPIAPHLSIYKPQMGSVLSSMMRITGVAYSGTLYLFGIAYLASPYLGWDLSSATIAAAFGSLPWVAKSLIKFAVAWPVVLHCINGVRHLTWDTARGFNNSFIMKTGWAAVGVTTLSAGYMVFFMN